MGRASVPTPALYPAFFFVLEKAAKSAGNAVIPTFPCIGHTDFKGLSNAVTNTHPLLPSMGTTRQKSSCRNRLQNGPRLLSRVKAGTHSPLLKGSHTAAHTPKHGRFGRGWYHYPRSVLRGSEALRGQVSERRTLPLLRLDPVCSRRTQRAFRTAMRLCASLFRGAAAPLGCVILFLLSKLWLVCHALRVFPRVRDMGGITTLGVLCVLLKRRTAACQNGSFVVF